MKNETIVDRVVERIKAAPLGDLITEEDLHEIVAQAVPRVFFQNRFVTEGSGYHERKVEKPPVIIEIMQELLKESAKQAVQEWLVKNADQVAEYWTKICDKNLLAYVQKMQDEAATAHVRSMLSGLIMKLNEERQKMGLPYLPL
jgi:hypothetical protein